jgi:hypothetical protein
MEKLADNDSEAHIGLRDRT